MPTLTPTLTPAEIQQLRRALGEDTATFGARFARSGRTVEDWEQGRRRPDRLVLALMRRIRRPPALRVAAAAPADHTP